VCAPRQRPQGAVPVHPRDALAELSTQVPLMVLGSGFDRTDRRGEHPGGQVAGCVDQDGDRRPEQGHEGAPEGGAGGLGRGVALLQPRVGPGQSGAGDQPGQEGLVGGIVAKRQQAQRGDEAEQRGQGQPVQCGEQRDAGEHHGPAEVGGDQDGAPAQPVGQHPDQQADEQVGHPACRVDETDVGGRAAQVVDDQHLQRHGGDVGAKRRHSGRHPEAAEPVRPVDDPRSLIHPPTLSSPRAARARGQDQGTPRPGWATAPPPRPSRPARRGAGRTNSPKPCLARAGGGSGHNVAVRRHTRFTGRYRPVLAHAPPVRTSRRRSASCCRSSPAWEPRSPLPRPENCRPR